MQLTTRSSKYHQHFWPDHKEEGDGPCGHSHFVGLGEKKNPVSYLRSVGAVNRGLASVKTLPIFGQFFFKRHLLRREYTECVQE